jgi:hypothetical protein
MAGPRKGFSDVPLRARPGRAAVELGELGIGGGHAAVGGGLVRVLVLRRPLRQLQQDLRALAGIIILLLWLFLTAFVVLVGAELNTEMELQTRRGHHRRAGAAPR